MTATTQEQTESYEPYPDPDRPGCCRLPLSGGDGRREAVIDADALDLVKGTRWRWVIDGSGRATVRESGPRDGQRALHRVIMDVQDSSLHVVHLNGDRMDCRRDNLAVRTRQETAVASRPCAMRDGQPVSSRFKGVTLAQSGRKWNAVIGKVQGDRQKVIQLGGFRSEIDAALAYDAAARELHGEHAHLNLPDPAEVERLRAIDTPFEPRYDSFPPPGWVDVYEAAAMLGVGKTTIHAWQRRGRITFGRMFPLPDDKPGRCKLYPVDELERLREEVDALGRPYPDPDRPGCYRVPVSGYLAYREVIIDAESLPIVEGGTWNWSPGGSGKRTAGQVILATMNSGHPLLARLIAGVDDLNLQVQFENGDPLDCRRANLVIKTVQERTFGNRKFRAIKGRLCTSKYKGVSWDKRRGLWLAQIRKKDDHRALGRFDREIDAAWAYDEAARELFGDDYAWFNFPDGRPRAADEYAVTDDDALEQPDIQARTSQYLGVIWEKYMQQWFANITVDGHGRRLGYFGEDEAAAARAYDDASREAYGEWATVNFPTDEERRFAARWYTSKQAARYFGITEAVWKNWIHDGRTPPGRMVASGPGGQHWVFPFDELKRLKDGMVMGKFVHRGSETKPMLTHGRKTSSRYRGVTFCKCTNRWRAILSCKGKTHHLGRFDREDEAARAYDRLARRLLRTRAWVNFPDHLEFDAGLHSQPRRAAA